MADPSPRLTRVSKTYITNRTANRQPQDGGLNWSTLGCEIFQPSFARTILVISPHSAAGRRYAVVLGD